MSIRSLISDWLRKLNLLTAAEQARFHLQRIKYQKENAAFKKEHPDVVLPPEFFIYETYRLNYKWYYEDGSNTAEEVVTLFSKRFNIHSEGIKILDWGCGPGRIVRHLPLFLPDSEIYGTDYNKEYIVWCNENLKGINFSTNKLDPPTCYNDSFFDAVIGLSIFTHLSEKSHYEWINELHRIIKFGGGLLLTTQGNGYYSKLNEKEKKVFDSGKLITRKYLNEGNRLYSSFQPVEFMKLITADRFEIIEYIPGKFESNEHRQDSWLLRKI